MITLEAEIIEKEVISIVEEICGTLKIEAIIDGQFCPGNYIKSQVLLDAIGIIEEALGITIPNDCYIFSEKNRTQLSIKDTVKKILKEATV